MQGTFPGSDCSQASFNFFHGRDSAHVEGEFLKNPLQDRRKTAPSGDLVSKLPGSARLLFVTSEMAGFVKSGGLGEVSAALPRKLSALCDVRVLIPGFRALRRIQPVIEVVRRMSQTASLPAWSLGRFRTADGLVIYAALCDELYDRDGSPYGHASGEDFADNDIRFGRLSLAAAEIAAGDADPNWKPDIVHLNDWPSALTAGYIAWKGLDTPSILTIHNLAYQGLFDRSRLSGLGIPERAFSIDGTEFYGKISFLKAGICYASHVTTVSETYAREITTREYGCGLEGLLRGRLEEGRLHGIVNGIDASWISPIDARSVGMANVRVWKQQNAAEIRRDFDLEPTCGPLFSIISRLVHQKGIDLSIEAAEMIVSAGGQIVVTGRGDRKLESEIMDLSKRYTGAVGAHIGFDDTEARKMFVASDFLLMPSRFEPCGLSQMYAQRCGTLPIACRTGGLADTIDDDSSGFLFSTANADGLISALQRALGAFQSKRSFQAMRRRAMAKCFDWARPAQKYANIYAQSIS
jgi:starch synthase